MIIKNLKKFIVQINIALLVLNLGLFFEYIKISNFSEDQIIFLNVRQGDSILVISNKQAGLIDAGPGTIVSERIYNYLPAVFKELSFVVLTHFDQDHIEGFLRIAKSYKINNLFITRSNKENSLINTIKDTAFNQNINTYYLNSLTDFEFGNFKFNVIWPQDINKTSEDSNDFSIGFEIEKDLCNIYTAGDLSSTFETVSLENIKNIDFEVLKAGHHGSRTSSSNEFISTIKPEFTIISAGEDNRYGHPHQEVINTLIENKSTILETKKGDIKLLLKNTNLMQINQKETIYNINCF